MVTTLFLALRALRQTLTDSRDLIVNLTQLLAAKDVAAYDALRRVAMSETNDGTEGPSYYYTGDAMQYQDDQLSGRVNDDELTGVSNFGL